MNTLRWWAALAFFFVGGLVVLVVGGICGPKRVDRFVRGFCRALVRLAGARVRLEMDPAVDPARAAFLVTNHVNLFDPFVLYAVVPHHIRGLELASHFRIPVYGWIMRRFGNVPVPDDRSPRGLKRAYRLAREAMDAGTSLVVFPEGSRTRDGDLGPFEPGAFRMARQLGVPIVPVSIEGAYAWYRTGGRRIVPGPVTVRLHAPVETADVPRRGVDELCARVRATIATAPR